MRVMIVGGNQMKNFAPRYYDFSNKLANGFARNNHTVVRYFDRDTSRLSNVFRMRKLGIGDANDKFLSQVGELRPQLILFIHADVIRPETLARLRDSHPAIKLAQVSVDSLFIPGNVRRINTKSPYTDATFMTTAGDGLRKISGGRPAYYIPNIVDPSMETGRAFDTDCDIDLIFVCGSFDAEGGDPRKAVLDLVRERLPAIKFPRHVDNETGGLWGADYMDTMARSKCGLNLSREREGPLNLAAPEDLYIYSSDRISHLTGKGVLTFSHRKYHLDRLFTEDEMVFFDSNDDLIDKIAHFLENEDGRRRIARNGWEKSHRDLNERLAAGYIVDVLFGDELSHPYIWPTEAVIEMQRTAKSQHHAVLRVGDKTGVDVIGAFLKDDRVLDKTSSLILRARGDAPRLADPIRTRARRQQPALQIRFLFHNPLLSANFGTMQFLRE